MWLLSQFESLKGLYECPVDKRVDCAGLCYVNVVKLESMSNQVCDGKDLVLR